MSMLFFGGFLLFVVVLATVFQTRLKLGYWSIPVGGIIGAVVFRLSASLEVSLGAALALVVMGL